MSSTFVVYFVGWGALARGLATEPLAWKGALFAIVFLAGAIVFDFGWFRDQMCTIACPYGRLQNVLSDQDTILVAYDEKRGDPKVKLKDRREAVRAGDCIDCRACVNACPTGTDIRRGLQPECIGTAQCIDACAEVMIAQRKPIGLIRYTSEREQKGGVRHVWRPRTVVYLALIAVAWGTLGFLVLTRSDALVEVRRGGRETYRLLPTGEVANQQRVRFTNQLGETQRFTIEVVSPKSASLVVSDSPVVVGGRPGRDRQHRHHGPAERLRRRTGAGPLHRPLRPGIREGSDVPPARPLRVRRAAVKFLRTLSEYRWPIYLGGLLAMPVVASASSSGWRRGPTALARSRATTRRRARGTSTRRSQTRAGSSAGRSGTSCRRTSRTMRHAEAGRRAVTDRDGQPVSGLAGKLFAIRPLRHAAESDRAT